MAEKSNIVIKKITVVSGGAHGGAWKVAFADFMTSMMAFFLVMWLVSQTEETKKSVAEYFSTPSVIEYNYSNYGVELTLEKLFLDLVNEPLKIFMDFITPVDSTPNLMAMGHKKIALQFLAEQLEDVATNVKVDSDTVEFEIPDHMLFEAGSAKPSTQFVSIMEKVKGITTGLEDSTVDISSILFNESVADGSSKTAKFVAEERADLISKKIRSSLEHESVDVQGHFVTGQAKNLPKKGRPAGKVIFSIKQKELDSKGQKNRQLGEVFDESAVDTTVYDKFVDQLTKRRGQKEQR